MRRINTIQNYKLFEILQQYIINKDYWKKDGFNIFNFEAGTGKSRFTKLILGQMCRLYDYKVLFVQLFKRDGQLDETVEEINSSAGKAVAYAYSSESKKTKDTKQAIQAQVLCVTHNLYKMISRGFHSELIRDRQILVIDEFIELMKPVTVNLQTIKNLWGDYSYEEAQIVADMLRRKLEYYRKCTAKQNEMIFVDFKKSEYDKYRDAIDTLIRKCEVKKEKSMLNNLQIIVQNGALWYEDGFHFYNSRYTYKLLENNIILDANGKFEYRYKISNLFNLIEQPITNEYSESTFYHFRINSGKNGIKINQDFYKKVLENIDIVSGSKILFITDLDGENQLEDAIRKHFTEYGDSFLQIQASLKVEMSINHFGGIKGLNKYRDYDTVVVLKTPNFPYICYAQNLLFYKADFMVEGSSIKLFKDDDSESIRNTIIAGEIYQALKRINRSNDKPGKYYLFSSNEEAVKIVLSQFPGIKYVYKKLRIDKKQKEPEFVSQISLSLERQKIAEEYLLKCKDDGMGQLRKNELRTKVGITDKGNFTRFLRTMTDFFVQNDIVLKGQSLLFNQE